MLDKKDISFSREVFDNYRLRLTVQKVLPGQSQDVDLQQAFTWNIVNDSDSVGTMIVDGQPVELPIPSGVVGNAGLIGFRGDIRTGFDDLITLSLPAGAVGDMFIVLAHLRPAQDPQPIVPR